jgi:hypothetical protein
MRTHRLWLIGLGISAAPLGAQATSASVVVPPAAEQIAAAVLPLPAQFRADATVLGYRAGSPRLVTLRDAKGAFVCLASDPAADGFHVACYHRSLEPFMARGRVLRAAGVKDDRVDSTRFAEVRAGTLAMPSHPAALYQLFGPRGAYDSKSGTAPQARSLFVVYLPGATAASTGLSTQPAPDAPWLMLPGTPKAHIMFQPKM